MCTSYVLTVPGRVVQQGLAVSSYVVSTPSILSTQNLGTLSYQPSYGVISILGILFAQARLATTTSNLIA